MEKINLRDDEGNDIELFVLEETNIAVKHYLLLAEDAEGDSDAYIFREEASDEEDDEATYVPVEDDTEFDAVLKIFEELMDDTDFD